MLSCVQKKKKMSNSNPNIPLNSFIDRIESCLVLHMHYSRYFPNLIFLSHQIKTFFYITFLFPTVLLGNLQGNWFFKHKSQDRLEIKSSQSIFRCHVSYYCPFRTSRSPSACLHYTDSALEPVGHRGSLKTSSLKPRI